MDANFATLNQKIDLLAAQVGYLTGQLETQQKRQLEFEELKRDMIPIVNHMVRLSIDELAEIGSDFQAEDLLFLLKRLLRNTNNLVLILDRMEGVMGLATESKILGKQMFNQTVETLDQLERKGFFEFARGAGYIAERVVTEFNEGDVRALGDNIVTILKTVRNMTQPEVLGVANRVVSTMQEEDTPETVTTWGLLKELSDPKVRKGMARLLNVVRIMADQPHTDPRVN